MVLTLPYSSFPLAQYMGLEVGEAFGGIARFSVADGCFESEEILDEVHALDKTPSFGEVT